MEAALIGLISSVTPNEVLSGKELSFRLKSLVMCVCRGGAFMTATLPSIDLFRMLGRTNKRFADFSKVG